MARIWSPFVALALALTLVVGTGSLAASFEEMSQLVANPNLVLLKSGTIDVTAGETDVPAGSRAVVAAGDDRGYFLVKVTHPVTDAKRAALAAAGLELLEIIPVNTFVARGPRPALLVARSRPEVTWTGDLHPHYKIDPTIGERTFTDGRDERFHYLRVTIWPGESMDEAVRALDAAGADVMQVWDEAWVRRVRARVPRTANLLPALAQVPAVKFIEEIGQITSRNNATTWVCQSNVTNSRPMWDQGLHGENQIVGHIDGRIDRNHCMFEDPTNNTPGPNHRKLVGYHSNSGYGADGHGTHTAGTVAGDQFPISGSYNENGHAYLARISHSNLNDITGWNNTSSNLAQFLTTQHNEGARVHTNSWGEDYTTQYTSFCVDIDTFSYQYEESLVVFAETNASGPVYTPENAKNVVGVGLTSPPPNQGSKPWGGSAPTADGRRKPEIFAPGSNTNSARAGTSCGFTTLGGTSMASPAITGNGALVRQYYTEGWYPTGAPVPGNALTPSGALIKATLMNGTVDMNPAGYPSNQEGWGRLLLDNALHFAGESRTLLAWDVRNASGLSTSQTTEYDFDVDANTEELRVTLVFTDPPASLLANPAPINDVSLEVETPTGTIYLGNVFDTGAGQSQTGGSADALNNVEQVLIPAPAVGAWKARAIGTDVPQGPQGYALVITGAVSSTTSTPPTADFSGNPTSGPAPLSVDFTDLSTSSPTSWAWDFGDGGTSSQQNPTYVYNTAGTYTVSLTATNAFGSDTETKIDYITVSSTSPPVADFTGTPTSGAAPLTVNFTDQSTNGPTSWSWDFGDGGTASTQNPSHAYTSPGTYDVTLTVTNAFGSDSLTRPGYITVTSTVTAEIVTGAGPDAVNAPVVKTWDHASPPSALASWTAYGAGGWGVNVAGVDMSAGGTTEIVTGPGPGDVYGPQIRGFDAAGVAVNKVNYYAYGTLKFGAFPGGSDLDADGHHEILSTPGPGAVFGPHVRGWNYDGIQLAPIGKVNFFAYGTLKYGARSAGGDVDGDAFDEILTGAGAGFVFPPHARVFDYDGTSVSGLASFFAFGAGRYGADVAGGDTDGDAIDELLVAHGPDTTTDTEVKGFNVTGGVSMEWSLIAFPGGQGGAEIAAGDLDADGSSELIAGPHQGPSRVAAWAITGASGVQLDLFDAYAGQSFGTRVATAETGTP